MDPAGWTVLLTSRGVDPRIIDVVREVAGSRAVEPPTIDTKQLLLAVEPDGYAAGRFGKTVLSLFLAPERAQRIGEQHDLGTGVRNTDAILRVPAARLDDPALRDLTLALLNEALDRVAHEGSWNRGLPDRKKAQGEICPIHFEQRSLTGVCPRCD